MEDPKVIIKDLPTVLSIKPEFVEKRYHFYDLFYRYMYDINDRYYLSVIVSYALSYPSTTDSVYLLEKDAVVSRLRNYEIALLNKEIMYQMIDNPTMLGGLSHVSDKYYNEWGDYVFYLETENELVKWIERIYYDLLNEDKELGLED